MTVEIEVQYEHSGVLDKQDPIYGFNPGDTVRITDETGFWMDVMWSDDAETLRLVVRGRHGRQ